MSVITLSTTGLAPVQQRFAVLGTDAVGKVMRSVFEKRGPEAVQYARSTFLTGGTTSTRLAERSGRLKASFDFRIEGQQLVTMHLGYLNNPPDYAAVHEGWPDRRSATVIRPRSSQYLAIPLTEDARRASGPRAFSDTFVQRSRRGNLLIFQRTGNGTIEPLYLLRSEVMVPSRPALYPTVDKFAPLIAQDLQEMLARTLRG